MPVRSGGQRARWTFCNTAVWLIAAGVFATITYRLLQSGLKQSGGAPLMGQKVGPGSQTLPTSSDKRPLSLEDAEKWRRASDLQGKPTVRRNVPLQLGRQRIVDMAGFEDELRKVIEAPPGAVYQLRSNLEQPLGPGAAENPLCGPFRNASLLTVAVVGNGPISKLDRLRIQGCDLVIRFNLMNNWQRYKEKVDVWVMRHSKEATAGYWGVNNISPEEVTKIMKLLKGVWFVGGDQHHADKVLEKNPILAQHNAVLMPEAPMNGAFSKLLEAPYSYPSTGFVAIQTILFCAAPQVTIHIFGMNWSDKNWPGHKVDSERDYIFRLQTQGRAVIHPTPCNGMRECGGGDIDNSCHWTSKDRYVCLRGKPKKWIDMTSHISDERFKEFQTDVTAEIPYGAAEGLYR